MRFGGMIGMCIGIISLFSMAALALTAHPHFPVSAKQAQKSVMQKYPRGKITEKTKLEDEEGVWQYSVMVRNGKTLREVMVNARTGIIDSEEVTNAVKEQSEQTDKRKMQNGHVKSSKTEKTMHGKLMEKKHQGLNEQQDENK